MARTVRDEKLGSRAARLKLAVRGKPYYRTISEGLHIGYRKNERSGKWVVRRYLEGGKYEVETLPGVPDDVLDANGVDVLSFAQAQEQAREIAARPHHRTGPYTVGQAVDDYLAHLKRQGKATAGEAEKRLKLDLGEDMRALKVSALTADLIRDWHAAIANSPKRTRAGGQIAIDPADSEAVRRRKVNANRILVSFKAALNHAFAEKRVHSDTEWRRVSPFQKVDRARQRYLTVEECGRLLNVCEGDFRDLVRGALETGCRYGELARLKARDYFPDSGTVYIHESKSGKSRHVALTAEGRQFFVKLTAGREPDAWMFGREWGRNHQAEMMRVACVRARIKPPVTFHTLRHTWASLAIMSGAPLVAVASNFGHRDTKMVEIHYGHLSRAYVAEAVDKFGPRFNVADERNVEPMRARGEWSRA